MSAMNKYFGGASLHGKVKASAAHTFGEVVDTLRNPRTVPISQAGFLALDDKQRNEFKQGPFFVPACFKDSPSKRVYEQATHCNLIFLDIDPEKELRAGKWVETGRFPAAPFVKDPQTLNAALKGFNFAAHLTASSTPARPRMRVIVDAEHIPVSEYPRAVAAIGALLGLPSITKESKVAVQPMFLPVRFDDSPQEYQPLLAYRTDAFPFWVGDILDSLGTNGSSGSNGAAQTNGSEPSADALENLRAPDPEISLAIAKDALAAIDSDCSRSEWVNCAAALKHQFSPRDDAEAFELFDAWSSGGTKYGGQVETRALWNSLRQTPPKREPVTIGSLLKRAKEAGWVGATTPAGDAAPLVSLMDIAPGPIDPRKTVLGNRFLCIGGALLFVGPSGIGKSSASAQQDILWSLGREAFGIRPPRPLRILTIQAENDAEDLAEMRDGVCSGLGLTAEERDAVRERVFYDTVTDMTGEEFLAYVEKRVALAKPDLLRIDPLQAYSGGDVSKVDVTAPFLRAGLSRILARHRCACVLNHHTPKVTNRDTSQWRAHDWMYAGAGSADITNWARAILVIDPTHCPTVFRFIAAKRGARIGWVDEDCAPQSLRHFCHAKDGVFWRSATDEDIANVEAATAAMKSGKILKTDADMMALVPLEGSIAKPLLLKSAMDHGFTKRGADEMLAGLLEAGRLHVWRVKRPGTNDEKRIARSPQSVE